MAIDFDALDEREVAPFMPEPDGLSLAEVDDTLSSVREQKPILGAGFTAFLPDERNIPALSRLSVALGF